MPGKVLKRPIDLYREEKNARDELYTTEKVKAIRIRRMNDELILAKLRDDLIEKRLVEQQASFLLIALRQKILTIPQTYARKILNIQDAQQASKILKEMAIQLLKEIQHLPQQITDPHWLEKLEDGDDV